MPNTHLQTLCIGNSCMDTAFGEYYSSLAQEISIEDANVETRKLFTSITLPKGKYIIFATVAFPTASSTGATNRQVAIVRDGLTLDSTRVVYGANNFGVLTTVCILETDVDNAQYWVAGGCSKASPAMSTSYARIAAIRVA